MKRYKCLNGHFFNIKPHVSKYSSVFICPFCGSTVNVHVPVERGLLTPELNKKLPLEGI